MQRLTIDLLVEAKRLLAQNEPADELQLVPVPSWAAKLMRKRGTWDDRLMVEQKPIPLGSRK